MMALIWIETAVKSAACLIAAALLLAVYVGVVAATAPIVIAMESFGIDPFVNPQADLKISPFDVAA